MASLLRVSATDEDLLNMAIKNYFANSDFSPTVQIRYRPPFIRTSTHDARGDAVSLAFESMIHRKFPLWAAYMIAYDFVNLHIDKLGTGRVPFTDDYKVMDATVWCRRVIESFEQYLRELSDGLQALPRMPEHWKQLPISFCAQKNRKPKMEDRHIILPTLEVIEPEIQFEGKNKDAFFAVFDGHHGPECAAYASAHFQECLLEALTSVTDMEDVLKEAFDRIDKRITARCRNENIKSGTTASCVYLKERKTAYLAWCGDSSIGVLQGDSVDTISTPHKPEDPEEMKRIEEAGGMVVNVHGIPRLNGVLNLSRSLGDIRAKPMVSPKPDVHTYPLTEHDFILFLASDGVWDNLEEEEIYEAIRTFIVDFPKENYEELAEFIVNKAKGAGAADNLTLICIFLKPIEEIWKNFTPS